jgi:hypothetical protein
MTTREERFRSNPEVGEGPIAAIPERAKEIPALTKHLKLGAQMRSALRRFPM